MTLEKVIQILKDESEFYSLMIAKHPEDKSIDRWEAMKGMADYILKLIELDVKHEVTEELT